MWCSARAAARLFAFVVALSPWTSPAAASDPSAYVTEILTPIGWELYGYWCGADDEPASSVELRIPEGWGSTSTREEPRWGSAGCSEVVVPMEWSANDPHRSPQRRAEFQSHSNNL